MGWAGGGGGGAGGGGGGEGARGLFSPAVDVAKWDAALCIREEDAKKMFTWGLASLLLTQMRL